MYTRKFYYAKRTNVVLFGFFMPLFLVVFACILVSNITLQNNTDNADEFAV